MALESARGNYRGIDQEDVSVRNGFHACDRSLRDTHGDTVVAQDAHCGSVGRAQDVTFGNRCEEGWLEAVENRHPYGNVAARSLSALWHSHLIPRGVSGAIHYFRDNFRQLGSRNRR